MIAPAIFIAGALLHTPVLGSWTSTLDNAVLPPRTPPVTRTLPSGNNVAVCRRLPASAIGPPAVQLSVIGSYSSALEMELPEAPAPPATSTLPFPSSVMVCSQRALPMEPVGTNLYGIVNN